MAVKFFSQTDESKEAVIRARSAFCRQPTSVTMSRPYTPCYSQKQDTIRVPQPES